MLLLRRPPPPHILLALLYVLPGVLPGDLLVGSPIARRSASGMTRGLPPEGPARPRRCVPEWPISRVLSRRRVAAMSVKVIPLDPALLRGSSTLTRTPHLDRSPGVRADRSRRCAYSSLLRKGLASPPVTRLSRVGSYPTISTLPVPLQGTNPIGAIGGVISAALSLGFPRVAVSDLPCPAEPGLSSRERFVFTGDLPATFGGQAHPNRQCGPGQRGPAQRYAENWVPVRKPGSESVMTISS